MNIAPCSPTGEEPLRGNPVQQHNDSGVSMQAGWSAIKLMLEGALWQLCIKTKWP